MSEKEITQMKNHLFNVSPDTIKKVLENEFFFSLEQKYPEIKKIILSLYKHSSHSSTHASGVIPLNDDFEKGEFEYKDKDSNIHKIKPSTNKTLLMDETLMHRVSPVKSGIRYSLITFFQFESKEKKTLL